MTKNILITGGTGMIGSALSIVLQNEHYNISLLSRGKENIHTDNIYTWDPANMEIDEDVLKKQHVIVHLAGAGVGNKRWTSSRKKLIMESRKKSTDLLRDSLTRTDHSVKTFISASAIGVYGYDTGSILVDEERVKPGDDFLAVVAKEWESSVDKISELGIRLVKIRIGVVLSENGGALPKLVTPIKYWIGAPLGSGDQYVSWIHLDDLCGIFLKAIQNESMDGVYNAVAPNPVSNKELVRSIADKLNKPVLFPNIPGFTLRLILGEMASMVLGGNRVSSKKIESAGYDFQYKYIEEALNDLL
ncbi:TIGR01777 family oxidoreductase [Bacteroidota bacterium]